MVKRSSTNQTKSKQDVKKKKVPTGIKGSKVVNNIQNKKQEDKKNEKPNATGKYIFFKNPKYANIAEKLVKLSHEEIQKEIETYNFNLQEKIHVGNLLSNKASKISQQGEYKIGKKLFYDKKKTEEFEKLYSDFLKKTRVYLQKLCELNNMPKSAPKETLSERVADGYLTGKIPKCPECNGGRLRFNIYNGIYFCPGFIDGGHFYSDLGDDYIFCNRTFNFSDIQRDPFDDKLTDEK